MHRPSVAAVREPELAPLEDLPGLHGQLIQAVRVRRGAIGTSFGAAVPIRLDVIALLYSSDHRGRLGLVPGLAVMERITRLALGDSTADPDTEARTVARAARYLSVQVDRLLDCSWSPGATRAVEGVVDEVLSRIDPARVRLDWEQACKKAIARIDVIDGSVILDDAHHADIVAEREACQSMVDCDYIDYEGMLYDAITARFMGACDPFEWYGFVVGETAWMQAAARSLLGLAEHSQRRLVGCPLCETGQVGLSPDPDVADCDSCSWRGSLSDDQADAWFRAFRDAGWIPERLAS